MKVDAILRWFRDYRVDRINRAHRQNNMSSYARIDEIVSKYRANGGLNHRYQHYKLFELNGILESFAPNKILELGSGSTTSIIADYVKIDPRRSAVIMDESSRWLENSRRIAGVEANDKQFRFIASETREDRLLPGKGYTDTPLEEFDFALVDGPSLRFDGQKKKHIINLDIFALPQPPKVVLIDIRTATVDALLKQNNYDVSVSDVVKGNVRYGYKYFSIGLLKGPPSS